jgi:TRAP-type C4-dicarboxylate transport system substrate-binding protein
MQVRLTSAKEKKEVKKLSILLIALMVTSLLVGAAISCTKTTTSTTSAPPASTTTSAPPAKAVVLRVAIPWPPGDPPQVVIQQFADKFNARAGGKYVMEVHPAEELVKTQESFDAVRTKVVEMAGYPWGVFVSVEPRLAAAEFPFLYTGIKAECAAQASIVPMYNQFMPQKYNQKVLGSFACLPLELVGNKDVKKLEDWKGLLVQAVSPTASEVITALGGGPVPSPFVEGYQVLEKKTVDATMTSCQFQLTFKLYEVAKYETLSYLVPASLGVTINMDIYNSMPKDIQAILDEEGANFTKAANDYFEPLYDQDNKELADKGIQVYVLPKDERDKWIQAITPLTQKILTDMGDWGQDLMKVADKVNTQYPY